MVRKITVDGPVLTSDSRYANPFLHYSTGQVREPPVGAQGAGVPFGTPVWGEELVFDLASLVPDAAVASDQLHPAIAPGGELNRGMLPLWLCFLPGCC